MFRFSMRLLMGSFALLGMAIAAAQGNSYLLSSLAFSLLFAGWGFSLVGALCQRGEARVFWIGFAIFAWLYVALAYPDVDYRGNRSWTGGLTRLFPVSANSANSGVTHPILITDVLFDELIVLRPQIGDTVSAQWSSGSYYDAVVLERKDGLYLVDWIDGSTDSWVRPDQIRTPTQNGRNTGHAILAVLVALWGGTLSRNLFGRPLVAAVPPMTTTRTDEPSAS